MYIYFKILEQTCGNQSSFCIFKDKKKKKVNAARFLDARGDEKQVINLERPYITLVFFWFQDTGHSFSPRNVIFGLREPCTIRN